MAYLDADMICLFRLVAILTNASTEIREVFITFSTMASLTFLTNTYLQILNQNSRRLAIATFTKAFINYFIMLQTDDMLTYIAFVFSWFIGRIIVFQNGLSSTLSADYFIFVMGNSFLFEIFLN